MFDISSLNEQVKTSLTTITGVSDWFTIEFSMMPSENPKGFLYPVLFMPTRSTINVSWVVAIKIADTDINNLNTVSFGLIQSLVNATANPENCLTDKGNFEIKELELELPKSYTNENIRSNVTAYMSMLSFQLTLNTGIN